MRPFILFLALPLILVSPVIAKSPSGNQPSSPTDITSDPLKTPTSNPSKPTGTQRIAVSPTSSLVQNQNQTQAKNQGQDQQLSVKTQEAEQLNREINESTTKVSDQVHQLIETVGAKGGIGQQVKEIAQSQIKTQQEIKTDFEKINSQSKLSKLILGSNKLAIQSLSQKLEQNRLMIQQLEQLKSQTQNQGDLQQLQLTIDLMAYQNTSLQNKIDTESQSRGMFGWILNLFRK
jgi:hypothetical protein